MLPFMTTQINFFHPATICNLITLDCAIKKVRLHQYQPPKFTPSDYNLLTFLTETILSQIQNSTKHKSYQTYRSHLTSAVNNLPLVQKLDQIIFSIKTMDDLLKALTRTMENLKEYKLDIGDQLSSIDIFLRRFVVYFQKLEYQDLVKVSQRFLEFLGDGMGEPLLNQFYIDSMIEEIKFNLENYSESVSFDEIEAKIDIIKRSSPLNKKNDFLRGLNQILVKKDVQGLDHVYRFLDYLFNGDRMEGSPGNSINQTIVNLAFFNLKLGYIDVAAREINESLTLSQNNGDQESINHCITYLYQISKILKNVHDEIRLTEHAMTHSVRLNNALLLMLSCTNYSFLLKNYNLQGHDNDVLKSKNIEWPHTLHLGRRKIFLNYENTCKQSFHYEKNLLFPLLFHKVCIINHIPELRSLFIQGVFSSPAVRKTNHFKLLLEESSVHKMIKNARICYYRNQRHTFEKYTEMIQKIVNESSIEDYVQYWNFKNQILIFKKLTHEAMKQVFNLFEFCRKKNFEKHHLAVAKLQFVDINFMFNKEHEALVTLQEIRELGLDRDDCLELRIKAVGYLLRQGEFEEAISQLSQIEEGDLLGDNHRIRSQFYLLKGDVHYGKAKDIEKSMEGLELRKLAEEFEWQGILECTKAHNLMRLKEVLTKRFERVKEEKYEEALEYIKMVMGHCSKLNPEYQYGEGAVEKLAEGIADKIRRILGVEMAK